MTEKKYSIVILVLFNELQYNSIIIIIIIKLYDRNKVYIIVVIKNNKKNLYFSIISNLRGLEVEGYRVQKVCICIRNDCVILPTCLSFCYDDHVDTFAVILWSGVDNALTLWNDRK